MNLEIHANMYVKRNGMLGSNGHLTKVDTISRDAKQSQGQLAVLPAAFRDNSEPRVSIRTRLALRGSVH